jgi:hypothetical protein
VALDEQQQHVALPKLYGAPAYARPVVVPVTQSQRPFDPDDLPIVAEQTDEERTIVESLPPDAFAPGGGFFLDGSSPELGEPRLEPRPFRLRSLAGRLLNRAS